MNKKEGFFARLSHPVDLTCGTPWKVIMRYAAPIMISYFLQQIYVLTDAIICGQVLTASEVAGVTILSRSHSSSCSLLSDALQVFP